MRSLRGYARDFAGRIDEPTDGVGEVCLLEEKRDYASNLLLV
jgi:hypothetical protein